MSVPVLATVGARGATEVPPEVAGEVGLIVEARTERDYAERGVRIAHLGRGPGEAQATLVRSERDAEVTAGPRDPIG